MAKERLNDNCVLVDTVADNMNNFSGYTSQKIYEESLCFNSSDHSCCCKYLEHQLSILSLYNRKNRYSLVFNYLLDYP